MRNNHTFLYFLFIAGGLTIAAGCTKTIEKTPISTLTTANFYKTATDAEAGLTGAYNGLYQQYYIWDYQINGDAQADNCYAGGNNPDNFAIDNFTCTPLNGNVTRDWQGLYAAVANANAVLDNVPAIEDVTWTGTTRKAQILGEAKFLRALHYFSAHQYCHGERVGSCPQPGKRCVQPDRAGPAVRGFRSAGGIGW
jgi:hypothetical protein